MTKTSFNKKQLIHAFNRSAKTCQQAQTLQQEIGCRLFDRLNWVKLNPQSILDIGAGTATLTHQLALQYPNAQTIGLDIAKQRLFEAQKAHILPLLCADAEALPLKDLSMDLVFSNLTLHWCTDLLSTFQQIRRILRPKGFFLFSMLGVDTLQEIRESWCTIDHQAHVYDFPDMHQVGDALLQSGFQDPVMDMESVTLEYPNLQQLLSDLKKSGVTYHPPSKHKGLSGKNHFFQFIQNMEDTYKSENRFPITFEIIYGHAISKFAVIQESSCGVIA